MVNLGNVLPILTFLCLAHGMNQLFFFNFPNKIFFIDQFRNKVLQNEPYLSICLTPMKSLRGQWWMMTVPWK